MTDRIHSLDTQAILLLCGSFGQRDKAGPTPLTVTEYSWLAQWLLTQTLRPADLLTPVGLPRLQSIEHRTIRPERLSALLQRGAAMAMAVEAWTNKGLWVLSRSDPPYPRRLKELLKQAAPPILYGVGNQALLSGGGLSIVGSREISETELTFTRQVAALCAQQGIRIISGGARGVDSEAMLAALAEGGEVVGVLADSLARAAVASKYRDGLQAGQLLLISPYDPQAGFTIGTAMGRNKYIYALSEAALVVNASLNQGGTWAGAVENLKHRWVPLLVRTDTDTPTGNQSLIEQGGTPIDLNTLTSLSNLRQWLSQLNCSTNATALAKTSGKFQVQDNSSTSTDNTNHSGLFEVVWPYLKKELSQPCTEQELAQILDLYPAQIQAWLSHAVSLGHIKQLVNPVRYVVVSHEETATQLSMFG